METGKDTLRQKSPLNVDEGKVRGGGGVREVRLCHDKTCLIPSEGSIAF